VIFPHHFSEPQTFTVFPAHKDELEEKLSYLFLDSVDTKLYFQPEKEIKPV